MSYRQQIITSFIIGFGTMSGALTAAGIVGVVSKYIYSQYLKENVRDRFKPSLETQPGDDDSTEPVVQMSPYEGGIEECS